MERRQIAIQTEFKTREDGDNPLMRWYTNNSKIERIGINNVYSKIEPKSRKTDGFKAFVGAMTECSLITKTYSSIDFKVYTY